MKKYSTFGLLSLLFILVGCEKKGMVNVYDKSILKNPPSCLSLNIIPQNKEMQMRLMEEFDFDPSCPYRLEIGYKNGIHCTSNQNAERKALTAFPSSFIRMKIAKGMKVYYSYYADLTKTATADDAEDGFDRIRDEFGLKSKR